MNKDLTQYAGYSLLELSDHNGRVVADKHYYFGQSKISAQMPVDEKALYYFYITMGGGFVEGEHYLSEIILHNQTSAVLTSQSPTYIYRNLNNIPTVQEVNIKLEGNSTLEYLMDDIIPYKQANFRQNVNIQMDALSTLVYLDGVTAGWSPDDLEFQYDDLQMRTKIYMNGELVVNDHLLSQPKTREDMKVLGLFEGYRNYNSLFVINPDIDDEYLEHMRAVLGEGSHDLHYAISKLEVPGFVLRVLSNHMDDSKDLILRCANTVRRELLDFPEYQLRKNDHKAVLAQ